MGTRRECGLFGQLDILILIELPKGIGGMGVGESGRESEVGRGGAHAGTCPVSLGSWHCCRGESRQTDGICCRRDQKPLQLRGANFPSLRLPLLPASPVRIGLGESEAEIAGWGEAGL